MSDLKIEGVLAHVLPIQTGVSKAGKEWSKMDFVIETQDGQFSKSVAFTLFGDKVKAIDGIGIGSTIEVNFNIESREYDGKWYSNINAWKVSSISAPSGVNSAAQNYTAANVPTGVEGETPVEDLPF